MLIQTLFKKRLPLPTLTHLLCLGILVLNVFGSSFALADRDDELVEKFALKFEDFDPGSALGPLESISTIEVLSLARELRKAPLTRDSIEKIQRLYGTLLSAGELSPISKQSLFLEMAEFYFESGKPGESSKYAHKAFNLTSKKDFRNRDALGELFIKLDQISLALKLFHSVINSPPAAEDGRDFALYPGFRANAFLHIGDQQHETQFFNYCEAYQLATEHDLPEIEIKSLIGLGNIYSQLSELTSKSKITSKLRICIFHSQRDYYERALRLSKEHHWIEGEADALIGLGNNAAPKSGDNPTAQREKQNAFYRQALSLASTANSLPLMIRAHIGLGNAWIYPEENFASAQDLLKSLSPVSGRLWAQTYLGLGNYLSSQTKNKEALKCYDTALEHSPEYYKAKIGKAIDRLRRFLSREAKAKPAAHSRK